LVIGALLNRWSAPPFNFPLFALCLIGMVLASQACFLALPKATNLFRLAWLQLTLDVVLGTAIVAVTGGPQSIFVFLYILFILAASMILSLPGGIAIASLASLLYAGLVLGRTVFPPSGFPESAEAISLGILTMLTNSGVFLVVAILTGTLAERTKRVHRALEDRQKDLSDLQAFKDLIFHSVGSGLIALDRTGKITAFNRAAEEITGRRAEETVGQPWETVLGRSIASEQIWASVSTESRQVRRFETLIRRQDGRQVPLGISFWPLTSGEGTLVGVIGVCQDLTEIKQMEQRMRQADRLAMLGRLATNIAHEIRNPLASLSGAIEVLARDLPQDESRGHLMEIVLRESDRLNRILKEFLEYARPAPLAPMPVNMVEILDEVLLLLEHRAHGAPLKVVREYMDRVPAYLDPQQMRQAIWNLCLNAVEAMPEGGELRVAVRTRPGRRLEVEVGDTGSGIAPEDLPHIFEPFYSSKAGGSGLGLALVHRVVQDHGGEIEVRSTPGAGTTFILSLPSRER
jgi:two-component system sensor histidine kinase PilS (NtrC family)